MKRRYVLSVALCVALFMLPFESAGARLVSMPLFATILLAWWFTARLTHPGTPAPIAEVGTWYMAAGTVYATLPLLFFLAAGLEYTPFSDARLFALQPSPSMVGRIGWMYLLHLAAFAISYVLVRPKRLPPAPRVRAIPRSTMTAVVGAWLLLTVLIYLSRRAIPASETYAGGYAAVAALPLAMRQFLRMLHGVDFIVTIAILVTLFSQYDRYRWLIAAWLLVTLAEMVLIAGERTGLVLSFSVCLFLYHVIVRPIRARTALLVAGLGLSIFMALGIFRTFRSVGSPSDFSINPSAGEFEALFGNAIDLEVKMQSGEIKEVPIGFHFTDLVAVIPSQLLPFQKVDLADWYVSKFYPEAKESGQGFAFGVIAQSIIGWTWLELAIRGVILGFVFAKLHSFYRRHGSRLWVTIFYVWLTVYAYQSFRATSFTLWPLFLQWFVPTVIVIESARTVLRVVGATSKRGSHTNLVPERAGVA